ncbi:hypothetical protein [Senegalia massiliensis]|uniref:Uncharacterized protein n=1 Tax=Senegalia massiliensis TaxID=1720316 RepID=A0A845R1E4_9CLOT|nr:hypothetical protein [Senegalia massiliensis]NBI08084.1 hypothetical protein [Senegalia massiliensis]
MKFGDIVINKMSSKDNPFRKGIFVKELPKTYEFTDGKGWFWQISKECEFVVDKSNNVLYID